MRVSFYFCHSLRETLYITVCCILYVCTRSERGVSTVTGTGACGEVSSGPRTGPWAPPSPALMSNFSELPEKVLCKIMFGRNRSVKSRTVCGLRRSAFSGTDTSALESVSNVIERSSTTKKKRKRRARFAVASRKKQSKKASKTWWFLVLCVEMYEKKTRDLVESPHVKWILLDKKAKKAITMLITT